MPGGRTYRTVVTVGDIDIYQVSASPSRVLTARLGSLAVQNVAPFRTWQNVDGATGWLELNNELNRPYLNIARLATDPDLYVGDWSANGGTPGTPSDITGDGTIDFPYTTIARALQDIGLSNEATKTILLAPGTFDLPGTIFGMNWVTVQGFESIAATATQSGAAVQADEEALILNVTGLLGGVDAHRGTLIDWTSGPASGDRGWIRKNGAEAAGITNVTVTQNDATTLNVPVAGNSFDLISLDSTVRLPEFFTVFMASVQANLKSVLVSETGAGFVLFTAATDKIGLTDCRLDIGRVQSGRHGGVELFNSYLAATGNPNRGVFSIRRGGDAQIIRGSVIDCDLRAVVDANRFVELDNLATLSYDGNCVFQGLSTSGIQCDGAFIGAQDAMDSHFVWSFDDCDGPAVKINSKGLGLSGGYQLPNLHGEVASTYAIEAEACGCVRAGGPGAGTNAIRTLSGGGPLNNVSADGGATAVAQSSDTTLIVNMTPAFTGFLTSAGDITMFFGGDYGGNFNDYRGRSVGSSGTQRFNWAVPDNFSALVSVELVGAIVGVGNVAGTYTLNSDYGAEGEQNDNHSETDATGSSDFSAAGETKAIDISSVYSVLAAGDYCGLFLDHTGIGTTMQYFFVKLVYTPT